MNKEGRGSSRDDPRAELTQKQLEELRRRLLDLRLNNRLLNFKFYERSRRHVRVIDELPDVVYGKLLDGKYLHFRALPEPDMDPADENTPGFRVALQVARMSDSEYLKALSDLNEGDASLEETERVERDLKNRVREQLGLPIRREIETPTPAAHAASLGFDPSYDLPRPDEAGLDPAKHTDNEIQTLLYPEQMERKLSGIKDGARLSMQEMGVNTLYAAFGFLEWYEADSSDRKLFAPLLLYPLEIGRKVVRRQFRYSIKSVDDEVVINITLRERLAKDFGIVVPDFSEESTPEEYLREFQELIRGKHRWKVRRFLTIGLFSFSRIAMYNDLDPKKWGGALHGSELLKRLLGGDQGSPPGLVEDPPKPAEIEVEPFTLIADADSSQVSAIKEALQGNNMAIKGPPGTGKSQTIMNLIAAAASVGKTVLFVAEKMAALDVVKKRLDDAGLGPFILVS